ncbi:MAG: enoyl-CoA hydratase/isomerase family protein [Deltaproteobacteria bacterium]|jgi:enoyl-CoA hydratase/carnithine racemase|nr:enoyl-CoA hydratase/isomerase family protein [Deltaproteobacteria bacterium]MBW2496642.1 enoyl-CoA hydratase/isomerase family protein [Deltaproteobacteria bacterium]
MEFHDLLYEKKGHVATITFHNPEKLNAMTGKMVASFSRAIEEVRHDDEVRVLVLTGTGRGFCTGADTEMLIALARGEPVPGAVEEEPTRRQRLEPVGSFGVEVSQLEKPTIAAVNGPAVGGGFAIAVACDLRIIAEDASFGMASTHRYALPPEGGITYTLPRIVGLTKACELLLTGDLIDGVEAERIGLATRAVPTDEVLPTAMELAEKIASNGPLGMEMTKQLIYRGLSETNIATQVEREDAALARGFRTEDYVEGATAWWIDKRKPVFHGR